jgi:hypothetical protein
VAEHPLGPLWRSIRFVFCLHGPPQIAQGPNGAHLCIQSRLPKKPQPLSHAPFNAEVGVAIW